MFVLFEPHLNLFFCFTKKFNAPASTRSYLWLRCWAGGPRCAGSRAGLLGWRSPSSSGSWWWAGWWRPCPAGSWWRPAAAASWLTHKIQSSLFPAVTSPHPETSPSSEPEAWRFGTKIKAGKTIEGVVGAVKGQLVEGAKILKIITDDLKLYLKTADFDVHIHAQSINYQYASNV